MCQVGKVGEWPKKSTKIKNLVTKLNNRVNQISKKTGNIHTIFSQTSTTTGRLTSNDPNLQNIPVRSEIGREIRKAFITSNKKENMLISFDYSQIELRVLAHLSKDETLIQSFIDGRDIHTETASKLFDITA